MTSFKVYCQTQAGVWEEYTKEQDKGDLLMMLCMRKEQIRRSQYTETCHRRGVTVQARGHGSKNRDVVEKLTREATEGRNCRETWNKRWELETEVPMQHEKQKNTKLSGGLVRHAAYRLLRNTCRINGVVCYAADKSGQTAAQLLLCSGADRKSYTLLFAESHNLYVTISTLAVECLSNLPRRSSQVSDDYVLCYVNLLCSLSIF
jgi:hypothetical protein